MIDSKIEPRTFTTQRTPFCDLSSEVRRGDLCSFMPKFTADHLPRITVLSTLHWIHFFRGHASRSRCFPAR